jgi:hypothetical protein
MVATIGMTLTSSLIVPTLAWLTWRAHARQERIDAYCANWHTEWRDNEGPRFCQGLWDEWNENPAGEPRD